MLAHATSCTLLMADALAIMPMETRIKSANVEFIFGGAYYIMQELEVAAFGMLNEESRTIVDPVQLQAVITYM